MSESKGKKVFQAPLLKEYLRGQSDYPEHIPGWIMPLGWALFLGLGAGLQVVAQANCLGFVASGAIAWLVVSLLRYRYRAVTDHEAVDEERYEVIRRLKGIVQNGSLESHVPGRVLRALEDAVDAYNGSVARLSLQDPSQSRERLRLAQQSLHACFLASRSMIRSDNQSKKEWKAVTENDRLINEVVATIDAHIDRIRDPMSLDSARLAALRELESLDDEVRIPIQD